MVTQCTIEDAIRVSIEAIQTIAVERGLNNCVQFDESILSNVNRRRQDRWLLWLSVIQDGAWWKSSLTDNSHGEAENMDALDTLVVLYHFKDCFLLRVKCRVLLPLDPIPHTSTFTIVLYWRHGTLYWTSYDVHMVFEPFDTSQIVIRHVVCQGERNTLCGFISSHLFVNTYSLFDL